MRTAEVQITAYMRSLIRALMLLTELLDTIECINGEQISG